MENDEDKKVDTQTTAEAEKTNAGEGLEKANTAKPEEGKQDAGNSNAQPQDNEEDVAKAFGNTAEANKNEADKSKKANSVAQTNKDGSITFKNQAELDGFIRRMYKKGLDAQKATEGQDDEEQAKEDAGQETPENNEIAQENAGIDTEGLRAEIALEMIDAEVDAKKARKAARLVDINKVSVNGVLDKAKLKAEIDEIIADWPELKTESTTAKKNSFTFGASQGDESSNSEDAEISRIFGNSKDV